MTTKTNWDIVTASIKNGEGVSQVMARVIGGRGTVEDVAAVVNALGGAALALNTFKRVASRWGLSPVQRLVAEYEHTADRYWSSMC
ncbi:hypothetical protein [Streptomyces decoyicus]|uniref:hypothetical protein n=1 Tax=Streptomyces decoyicus TaxID=249567 RepID=UPI003656A52B